MTLAGRPMDVGLDQRPREGGALGPRRSVGAELQPTLAELSASGRRTDQVPHAPADALEGIPAGHLRASPPGLPELSEPQVIRHFTNLSHLNHSVDGGFTRWARAP